ncbi:hypothetical protein SPRG_00779 [Saprolegnia parasitica CBS 223.65]|uniref:DNA recombination and repair protein Rad51-like C-terminal domain-containing protein n=1 Tax=Saprolegnia parasitica (strain CBS 223.65) TaxID=695850 RepID=A0A067D6V0_SAPPC|nr:hypothetical protein SPRG_00779 [Saprolegnia parasitica CBS 223.65]KDO34717.1 hypothetical protein SPRG_00779 [Saprolegnia parasitica CBS 223.65]|eukprot:XP_012194386.1 hypothetical protein SPRG_00779 [Saprolegnia parasitica CBS 223.65]
MWALDETALDLVQRTWYDVPFRCGIDVIDAVFPDGIPSRAVVELYGDAASPRSLVLQHLVATFLLQHPSGRVYYFDHECHLDAVEMRCVLEGYAAHDEAAVVSAMQRLELFHAPSTAAFSAELRQVHEQLLAAKTRPANVLVAVDAISSFHLIDKAAALRVGEAVAPMGAIYAQLKDFARTHSAFLFVTKANELAKGWGHAEYMPSVWSSLVTKRLSLRTRTSPGTAFPSPDQSSFQLRHFANAEASAYSSVLP